MDCSRKYGVAVLLPLWLFFILGICPWDSSSLAAQPIGTAHAQHTDSSSGHNHHASGGSEHACSGSISFTKNDLHKNVPLLQTQTIGWVDYPLSTNLTWYVASSGHLPLSFSHTKVLPKLFSHFYKLHENYRI